jgi:hypothetical protein
MRTISLRLDDVTANLLLAYCEQHGLTQTDAIKQAIEQLGQQQPRQTPSALAAELGLIGSFSSGRGDLSRSVDRLLRERLADKRRRDSEAPPKSPAPAARRRSPAAA